MFVLSKSILGADSYNQKMFLLLHQPTVSLSFCSSVSVTKFNHKIISFFHFFPAAWWSWRRTSWNSWWTWCSRWCAMASWASPACSARTSWIRWNRRSCSATQTPSSPWPPEGSLQGIVGGQGSALSETWGDNRQYFVKCFVDGIREAQMKMSPDSLHFLTGRELSMTSAVMRLPISSLSWMLNSSIR